MKSCRKQADIHSWLISSASQTGSNPSSNVWIKLHWKRLLQIWDKKRQFCVLTDLDYYTPSGGRIFGTYRTSSLHHCDWKETRLRYLHLKQSCLTAWGKSSQFVDKLTVVLSTYAKTFFSTIVPFPFSETLIWTCCWNNLSRRQWKKILYCLESLPQNRNCRMRKKTSMKNI